MYVQCQKTVLCKHAMMEEKPPAGGVLSCDGSGNDCYLMHNIIIHDRNCEDSPAKTCSAVAVLLAGKVATQCLKARGLSAQMILSLANIVVKSADTSYSCEIP